MGLLQDFRRKRFWYQFFTHTFSLVGALAVIAGVLDVFFDRLFAGKQLLIPLGVLIAIVYGLVRAWPRPIEVSIDSPRTTIRIVRGDLFAQGTSLAIGVCDTFDTASPYIASTSVQWQFQVREYAGDVARLDSEISAALADSKPIETIDKAGKTLRYKVGTVVSLGALPRRHYLVAYSRMDGRNKAASSVDALWTSLTNLWIAVREGSNGAPVSMPVIGGGQSGLSAHLPAEDAIRLTVLSYMIAARVTPICEELRIVAQPSMYDKLNHPEIQAFLSSLKRA